MKDAKGLVRDALSFFPFLQWALKLACPVLRVSDWGGATQEHLVATGRGFKGIRLYSAKRAPVYLCPQTALAAKVYPKPTIAQEDRGCKVHRAAT